MTISPMLPATGQVCVQGYAAVFHTPDLEGDIILPGAFRDTLRRRQPSQIRMLAEHQGSPIIGRWAEIREDQFGLFVSGQVALAALPETSRSAFAGAGGGLSIGYFPRLLAPRASTVPGRILAAIDLVEISLVCHPMQTLARFHMPTPPKPASLPGRVRA